MRGYNTLPEPERIKRLPHYKGLPVTATTLVVDGIPNFRAIDGAKVWEYKRDGKCAICGEPLDYWKAFMVTEEEVKSQFILESPQHEDCLRFAFSICPWLFYSKAKYGDISTLPTLEGLHYEMAHPDRFSSNGRPPTLGIYICNRYENEVRGKWRGCKVPAPKRLEWIEGQ